MQTEGIWKFHGRYCKKRLRATMIHKQALMLVQHGGICELLQVLLPTALQGERQSQKGVEDCGWHHRTSVSSWGGRPPPSHQLPSRGLHAHCMPVMGLRQVTSDLYWHASIVQLTTICNHHRADWLVSVVGPGAFDRLDHIHAIDDLSEHDVFAIEMRRRCRSQEKLTAVGVWPGVL